MSSSFLGRHLRLALTWLPVAALALGAGVAQAARPDLPTLSEAHEKTIEEGKFCLISSHETDGETAHITGLMEIDASDEKIWEIILDPDSVLKSAKAMKEVTLTRDEVVADGHRELEVSFLIKVGLSEVRYHVVRHYHAADHHMTFEMDRSKDNDIDWTEGSYTTYDGLTAGQRLLVYTLVIDTGRNVPQWLEEDLTGSSLKRYLLYVKKAAEE